ncbi:response regulator transcription factor [Myceligenerans pegani]|uniref:Response regulator transcription factor n=1 Tax=Myceligenerans pegani TaxID=2776917 RepID=A0ABR9N3P7_9MICO|nr:LuxR C-terminal-related transcriptional regulator [Myceligenerans sp. TRM 65318]MBE1877886.1 response regulator transcription factor [Myceligenerans sp. TRM 65318]MBE3020157.1 response regulator transcription factor [Myceligenerans sp. TRM 65318]
MSTVVADRPALTRRERVVLEGLMNKEETLEQIAETLFVTRNTVKSQVRSLYRKLGVSNRAAAVERAERLGLNSNNS